VRFDAPAALDLAALSDRLPAGVVAIEARPGSYELTGEIGPQVLADLTAWCAARDVMPEGLAVVRRSLEDVFMELTGRELRT
jgi:ABC-2 type transport system ATP-binding protein